MKKLSYLLLSSAVLLALAACQGQNTTATESIDNAGTSEETETLTGTGKGYGGPLTVEVTRSGEDITDVVVTEHSETDGIGTNAIDEVPGQIIESDETDVEAVSGATVTSDAVIYAVNNALDSEKYPDMTAEQPAKTAAPVTVAELYRGMGIVSNGRLGPGQDDTETPVYSFNVVIATTLFDEEDRIVDLHVDIVETATPNYDGEGMPHLSGFPGQGGYNVDEDHDGVVDGMTEDSEDQFLSEIENWETKRERGDAYVFGPTGSWYEQMDAFENHFIGMTVGDVEEWFASYTSEENGRPLTAEIESEIDQKKYNSLNEEEQEMLSDVTTSATMSLNDSHGDIIGAISASYENKEALNITLE